MLQKYQIKKLLKRQGVYDFRNCINIAQFQYRPYFGLRSIIG